MRLLEVPVGIAPTYGGFADPCLTTWLRHRATRIPQASSFIHRTSSNILPETFLTVDCVGCVRSVRREHAVAALSTCALMECAFISQRHASLMTATGTLIRERQLLLGIDCYFLWDHQEFFGTFHAFEFCQLLLRHRGVGLESGNNGGNRRISFCPHAPTFVIGNKEYVEIMHTRSRQFRP